MNLRPLTDDALLARLESLVDQERENIADIVEHLAEVDRRDFIPDRGFPTLFEYCRRKLRYSEAGAFLRIRAARASVDFPRVLEDLRAGKIHLDAIMRLYPYLDEQNSDRLLDLAAGASKREVMSLVAAFDGAPPPERDVIRPLPVKEARPQATDETPGAPNPEIIPPVPRVRLSFTADNAFLVMVERLKSLRRHKYPAGRLEDVLKEAVAVLLAKIDLSRKPLRGSPSAPIAKRKRSRRIPAAVKREVWDRDGGRCAYVAEDGRRCESRDFLEYDHITPWAIGGRSDTAENVRLLCRPHNQRLARRRFGPRANRKLLRPDAAAYAQPKVVLPAQSKLPFNDAAAD